MQIPPRQLSHVAQVLAHVPLTPHAWHRLLSHVLWQTPEVQAWHWPAQPWLQQTPSTQLPLPH